MLAGVPLALARNMPGAGPANLLILSMLTPPWRLVTVRSWVQPPLRPSSQKQWYLQCFLHYRAVKPGFFLGCLDRLQIQHEEKGFIVSASSNMAALASIWGAFFFLITFNLPFHALPLLSPHPASFRSFTPGASSLLGFA